MSQNVTHSAMSFIFFFKKWAQEVASLYYVALRWRKQERQDRKDRSFSEAPNVNITVHFVELANR